MSDTLAPGIGEATDDPYSSYMARVGASTNAGQDAPKPADDPLSTYMARVQPAATPPAAPPAATPPPPPDPLASYLARVGQSAPADDTAAGKPTPPPPPPPASQATTDPLTSYTARMAAQQSSDQPPPAGLQKPPVMAPRESTRVGPPDANPQAQKLTGPARLLTQYVAAPMMENPLTTAATALVPGAAPVMAGLMGKKVVDYAAQKAAEATLPPDVRKMAEADPSRISGEEAAMAGGMLALAPLLHGGLKAASAIGDVSGGVMEAGAKGVGEMGGIPKAPIRPTSARAALDVFGPEGARRYEAAQRTASRGTPAQQDAAEAVLTDMEGKLTPEQKDRLYTAESMGLEPVTPSDLYPKFTMREDAVKAAGAVKQMVPVISQGKQAENIMRSVLGHGAAEYEQSAQALHAFSKQVDALPPDTHLQIIDNIEGGKAQTVPELQPVANALRQTLDHWRQQVQDLGTGKLDSFIENYFPHIWADPDQAANAFNLVGRRPMEGSKAFLKQRSLPTTADGIAMGLEPVTTNPIDLTLLKVREMQKYVMAHQALNQMKDAGLVKFVRAGEQAPDGYDRIDDRIATVFGPRQGGVTLPEGAQVAGQPMAQSDVGVLGTRIMGEYRAPKEVATIVNNYLSPGMSQYLRDNVKAPGGELASRLFDLYKGTGNTLNQAQLGLSGFHVGTTTINAWVSQAALGAQYLADGRPIMAAQKILTAPLAPITNFAKGYQIRKAGLDPNYGSPELQALTESVKTAGGRFRQPSDYQNGALAKMIDGWKQGGVLGTTKAAGYSIPAIFETLAKPMFDHYVPLQKLGAYGDMAQRTLGRLAPDATMAERQAAQARDWDSIDNRYGQLVYDNLFWHKTIKDLAMASTRSVGWNLGTIRELGGGATDLAKMPYRMAKGQSLGDAFTPRAAYTATLPIAIGLMGAAYQYLRTGQGPQELKDYFYPRTGEVDADGNPERVQLPSYMRDMVAYAGHPWETVKHKIAPLPNAIYEMLQNQNYDGDEIRNPQDPAVQQMLQFAHYVGQTVTPISIRNMQESGQRGDQSAATRWGNQVGITPAPRAEVRSDAQNRIAEYQAQSRSTGATPEMQEARQARGHILAGVRGGQGAATQKAVSDALERRQITPEKLTALLRAAGSTPAQEKFKQLTLEQAVDVFKRATPREKSLFSESFLQKLEHASR